MVLGASDMLLAVIRRYETLRYKYKSEGEIITNASRLSYK